MRSHPVHQIEARAERCLNGDFKRKLFNGKCQIVVQAGKSAGNIEIEATGDGLQKVVCVIAQQ